MTKHPRSLGELLAETREFLKREDLPADVRAEFEARCREVEQMSQEERDGHDYFLRHMPDDDGQDPTLVVLKGQLLIEQRVREFIDERMLAPAALESARLTAHQVACLGEALTLPNDEPRTLWSVVRLLNQLRNKIAHNLAPADIEKRVQQIIETNGNQWGVKGGLSGVMAHCYGQLTELCRLARSKGFRIRGKS